MKRVITLIVTLALLGALTAPALAAGTFADVPESSPFAAAIQWAVEEGITNGTTPATFSPGATCTVSHILTFLWRASGRPGGAGDERAAVAAWASGLGIGVSNLSAPCTRAAAVTYIWKAQGSPAPAQAASFADVPAGADYARAVSWAVAQGVTNGAGGGAFSPDAACTRGQIVTFLHRALAAPAAQEPAPQPVDKPTTIAVSSSMNGDDTMWTVADNGYDTGYLNNGKPITEENVMELIDAAKPLWPQGMDWQDDRYAATNVCDTKNANQTYKALEVNNKTSHYSGCGGFAALINNYVFGKTNNPIRKLTDNTQAKPGDILVFIDKSTNKARHVAIFTGYTISKSTGKTLLSYSDGGGLISEGYGIINWDKNVFSQTMLANGNSATRYEVWTRYPA